MTKANVHPSAANWLSLSETSASLEAYLEINASKVEEVEQFGFLKNIDFQAFAAHIALVATGAIGTRSCVVQALMSSFSSMIRERPKPEGMMDSTVVTIYPSALIKQGNHGQRQKKILFHMVYWFS
ncbi:MAG: hypothetical protein R2795_15075 [Saprospiraceae bacterium]